MKPKNEKGSSGNFSKPGQKNLSEEILAGLASHGRKVLQLSENPQAEIKLLPCTCPQCGWQPVEINLIHFKASSETDFFGTVDGSCSRCGVNQQFLRIAHLEDAGGEFVEDDLPAALEHPLCGCGSHQFHTAIFDLYDSGIFDEGLVIGSCADCGQIHTIARYD